MIVLEKKLSESEKKRHYVHVPKDSRKEFPESERYFDVKFMKHKEKTFVDYYDRLRLGSRVFHSLDLDEKNSVIIVKKDTDGLFFISKETMG